MNALVKKEIRLLLPAWLTAMVLAIVPFWAASYWLLKPDDTALFDYVFLFGIMFLGLASFGHEFSSRTFPLLLVQPIYRRRIWSTKIMILALAYAAVLLALFVSWKIYSWRHHSGDWFYIFGFASRFEMQAASGLAVLVGGLWTTLLLRQVAAAFWFTILVPAFLMILFLALAGYFDFGVTPRMQGWLLLLYSVAGFFFARWLFLRAQDAQWSGGNIVLPEWRGREGSRFGSGTRRRWRPRAALQAKEFQLHQSQLVVAGVLVVLHLGVLAIRHRFSFPRNSTLEFVLASFWWLWLAVPWLVGCAAAAEERKLGTLEAQLCLPVRHHTQFAVKAGGVLVLSLLFGVAMPLLLEGPRMLAGGHLIPSGLHFDNGHLQWMSRQQIHLAWAVETIKQLAPLLTFAGLAAGIGLISFYVSTLSRNTLQALAPAVLVMLLAGFLVIAAAGPANHVSIFGLHALWRGALIYFIGVPVFVATLLVLAGSNSKHPIPGGHVWLQNLLTLLVTLGLIVLATTAIYHRAWEKLTPFEPPHGKPQLTLSNPATVADRWSGLSVRLPDGRVWTDDYNLDTSWLFLGGLRLDSIVGGHFYEGSNWISVEGSTLSEQVGLKADGTLWVSEHPASNVRMANGGWKMEPAGELVRFGAETNWSSFVRFGRIVLLVKHDGTLWRWGPTEWDDRKHEWTGLRTFTPTQLGTETNWAEVFEGGQQLWFRKTDGNVWVYGYYGGEPGPMSTDLGLHIERAPFVEPVKWRSITTTFNNEPRFILAVLADGTFRVIADDDVRNHQVVWSAVDLRLGHETHWLAAAGRDEKIVTLKDDGTIWVWNFNHDPRRGWDTTRNEREMAGVKPVQLGTQADWIAIASANGGIFSLAADGTLWYWPLESADYVRQIHDRTFYRNDNFPLEPLLDVSRKPEFLGNVFSQPSVSNTR